MAALTCYYLIFICRVSSGRTRRIIWWSPIQKKEFFAALKKAINNLADRHGVVLTVKSVDVLSRVKLNRLVYAETDNHVQKLYLSDGSLIKVRKSSTELFELLEEEPRFYKCGSTYIINMDYIVELSAKSVSFSTGTKIPMKRVAFHHAGGFFLLCSGGRHSVFPAFLLVWGG